MKRLLCSPVAPGLAALSAITFAVSPARAEEKTESVAVSEFTFEFGKPWIRQQAASSMRAAQLLYEQEDESLEDIELVLFYFGESNGGGTQANIDRWVGQFEGEPEKKIEAKKYGDREVTYLEAKGTFLESMGGGPFSGPKTPKAGYMMLAAILPSDRGWVFLKTTGPEKSVAAMKEAFYAFAESALEE